MAKFSGTKRRPLFINRTAPVATTNERTRTFEGGEAFARDPESELFTLAVTNMVREDTFYERGDMRDARFVELVHAVTASNPAFIAGVDPDIARRRRDGPDPVLGVDLALEPAAPAGRPITPAGSCDSDNQDDESG